MADATETAQTAVWDVGVLRRSRLLQKLPAAAKLGDRLLLWQSAANRDSRSIAAAVALPKRLSPDSNVAVEARRACLAQLETDVAAAKVPSATPALVTLRRMVAAFWTAAGVTDAPAAAAAAPTAASTAAAAAAPAAASTAAAAVVATEAERGEGEAGGTAGVATGQSSRQARGAGSTTSCLLASAAAAGREVALARATAAMGVSTRQGAASGAAAPAVPPMAPWLAALGHFEPVPCLAAAAATPRASLPAGVVWLPLQHRVTSTTPNVQVQESEFVGGSGVAYRRQWAGTGATGQQATWAAAREALRQLGLGPCEARFALALQLYDTAVASADRLPQPEECALRPAVTEGDSAAGCWHAVVIEGGVVVENHRVDSSVLLYGSSVGMSCLQVRVCTARPPPFLPFAFRRLHPPVPRPPPPLVRPHSCPPLCYPRPPLRRMQRPPSMRPCMCGCPTPPRSRREGSRPQCVTLCPRIHVCRFTLRANAAPCAHNRSPPHRPPSLPRAPQ